MHARRMILKLTLLAGLTLGGPADAQTGIDVRLRDATAAIGGAFSSALLLDGFGPGNIQGWTLNVCHDVAVLDVLDISLGSTTQTINGGLPPSFEMTISNPPLSEGAHIGVVIDFFGVNSLPPGSLYEIAVIDYEVEAQNAVVTNLRLCDDNEIGGASAYQNVIVVEGGGAAFDTFPAVVTIGGGLIRGDSNGDGALNLADPITTIEILFQGGMTACARANDSNGDGLLNLADVAYSLAYINGLGPQPPAPFPTCGVAAPSPLDCTQFNGCP